MTTDFVRYTVERLEAKKRAESPDRRLPQAEEIRRAQAPLKWQALEQWLKKHCEDCRGQDGKLLEFRGIGSDQFEVIELPPLCDTLSVVFDPLHYTITIKKGRNKRDWVSAADKAIPPITFDFAVDGEHLLFAIEYAGVTMSVEQMGQTLIRALLGPFSS